MPDHSTQEVEMHYIITQPTRHPLMGISAVWRTRTAFAYATGHIIGDDASAR